MKNKNKLFRQEYLEFYMVWVWFFMFNNVKFSLIIYSCGLLVKFGYNYYIW